MAAPKSKTKKTKAKNGQGELSLFASTPVPKMPEGYYSGDKPNPNLRAFVEAHLKEHPYDTATDTYDVPAFNRPIETTKATAIYNMHAYWSKKPYDAIQQYVRHYTQAGDLLLDPFCGSGSTALAALMEGRKAIAIDRSPAATFITKNYCTPIDGRELEAAFEDLMQELKPEIELLYETRCDRCGGKASTNSVVYSHIFSCPRCLKRVPLFDCVEVNRTRSGERSTTISVCPYCLEGGHEIEISTRSDRLGTMPVLVNYSCAGDCTPRRSERRHNDSQPTKRLYFETYDRAKIQEIEALDIPYWYPRNRMLNAPELQERWALLWRPYHGAIGRVYDFFTKRNLRGITSIIQGVAWPFVCSQ